MSDKERASRRCGTPVGERCRYRNFAGHGPTCPTFPSLRNGMIARGVMPSRFWRTPPRMEGRSVVWHFFVDRLPGPCFGEGSRQRHDAAPRNPQTVCVKKNSQWLLLPLVQLPSAGSRSRRRNLPNVDITRQVEFTKEQVRILLMFTRFCKVSWYC